jgi:hypothetical protein
MDDLQSIGLSESDTNFTLGDDVQARSSVSRHAVSPKWVRPQCGLICEWGGKNEKGAVQPPRRTTESPTPEDHLDAKMRCPRRHLIKMVSIQRFTNHDNIWSFGHEYPTHKGLGPKVRTVEDAII